MANDYFDNADPGQRFQPGTTAEAEAVEAKFDGVATGFDRVQAETDRSLKLPAEAGISQEIAATALQRRSKVLGFDAEGALTLADGITWRGNWAASTEYFVNDVVVTPTSKNWYICRKRHTSGATFGVTNWSLGLDYADVKATLETDLQPLVSTATDAATTATQKALQTATDRQQTQADRAQTGEDRAAATQAAQTAIDNAGLTAQDRQQTAADRNQTGLDRQQTTADRTQTGQDRAAASQSATTASDASSKAQRWANEPEGAEVEPGKFSALHWAEKAKESATGGVAITDLKPGLLATEGDYPSVDETGAVVVRNVPDDVLAALAAGSAPAALQRYDLTVNTDYQANATTAVDLDLSGGPQVAIVGNSSLRTVNLNNPPADRSILVIVYATGAAGFNFTQLPSAGYWDGGEVPEAGTYWTQYLLWWTGSYWRGGVGIKR